MYRGSRYRALLISKIVFRLDELTHVRMILIQIWTLNLDQYFQKSIFGIKPGVKLTNMGK